MKCSYVARFLGVKFESTLSFRDPISAICSSGYYYLRNTEVVRKYLPRHSFLGLIYEFVIHASLDVIQLCSDPITKG